MAVVNIVLRFEREENSCSLYVPRYSHDTPHKREAEALNYKLRKLRSILRLEAALNQYPCSLSR